MTGQIRTQLLSMGIAAIMGVAALILVTKSGGSVHRSSKPTAESIPARVTSVEHRGIETAASGHHGDIETVFSLRTIDGEDVVATCLGRQSSAVVGHIVHVRVVDGGKRFSIQQCVQPVRHVWVLFYLAAVWGAVCVGAVFWSVWYRGREARIRSQNWVGLDGEPRRGASKYRRMLQRERGSDAKFGRK